MMSESIRVIVFVTCILIFHIALMALALANHADKNKTEIIKECNFIRR